MASIDVPVKRLMQSRIEDWIKFLVPECKEDWIKEMDASKVPAKKESRLDKLILIDSPDEKFILNIEPQGYLDYKMPARMLRYRADIWEHTIEIGLGMPSVKQAVIYFYKAHDNKKHFLVDKWEGEETLNYSYKAIKIWEIESDMIIKNKLEGLYPLIPLMDSGNDTDEEIMEKTVDVIKKVRTEAFKADLLAVMTILAGDKFTSELITKYVRREMLMSSPIYNEWVEEERREAAERATEKNTKDNIIYLLESKFEFVPSDVKTQIEAIDDISILKGLLKKLLTVSSIEEFEALLNKIKTLN